MRGHLARAAARCSNTAHAAAVTTYPVGGRVRGEYFGSKVGALGDGMGGYGDGGGLTNIEMVVGLGTIARTWGFPRAVLVAV